MGTAESSLEGIFEGGEDKDSHFQNRGESKTHEWLGLACLERLEGLYGGCKDGNRHQEMRIAIGTS